MNKEAQPTPGMGPTPPGGRFLHGVDWAVKAGVVDEVMLGTRVRVRRRRQRRLAAASGLAVVALACGLWFSRRIFTPAPMNAASAIVDMPQRMTLVDGSVCLLYTSRCV